MDRLKYIDRLFIAKDLRAWNHDGKEVKINGKFRVVAYEDEDPSVGIFGPVYFVTPKEIADDIDIEDVADDTYTVEPDDLMEIIEPDEFKRMREWEAQAEADMEEASRRMGDEGGPGI